MCKIFRFIAGSILIPVLVCSCAKREMTQAGNAELIRKIQSINNNIVSENYDSIEKDANAILSFCQKVKADDIIQYAVSFAKNMQGYCFFQRGEKSVAEKLYIEALKEADLIEDDRTSRIQAKSRIYLNLIMLYNKKSPKQEDILTQWGSLFQEPLVCGKCDDFQSSRETILMYYGIFASIKANCLIVQKKWDDAEQFINNALITISKYNSESEKEYSWVMLLYDDLVKIYQKKNNMQQMHHWIKKCFLLAEKWNLFPENSFLALIEQYLKNGQYPDAVEYCKKGLALCEKDSHAIRTREKIILLILMAEAFHKSGNPEYAKDVLTRAESMNPPPELLSKIQSLRKKLH
ncbi:MAG: hypothetical protein IKO93_14575 [Lentisphaeria bacterium]|nr:hypothetical protein [Lentisphaeria bacterium]